MYRKEEIASLLKDPEELEGDDLRRDNNEKTPTLKWHKVIGFIGQIKILSALVHA